MELLVGALEKAAVAEQAPFVLGQKGHMRRGQIAVGGDFGERIGQRPADRVIER